MFPNVKPIQDELSHTILDTGTNNVGVQNSHLLDVMVNICNLNFFVSGALTNWGLVFLVSPTLLLVGWTFSPHKHFIARYHFHINRWTLTAAFVCNSDSSLSMTVTNSASTWQKWTPWTCSRAYFTQYKMQCRWNGNQPDKSLGQSLGSSSAIADLLFNISCCSANIRAHNNWIIHALSCQDDWFTGKWPPAPQSQPMNEIKNNQVMFYNRLTVSICYISD